MTSRTSGITGAKIEHVFRVIKLMFLYRQKESAFAGGSSYTLKEDSTMKKKDEVRYFVTAVASVLVYKVASKTEVFRISTKPGWGAVEWYSAADG